MSAEGTGTTPMIGQVAVVGLGVIGRSWIRVFARAGCQVRAYDSLSGQVAKALEWLETDLAQDVRQAAVSPADAQACLDRVSPADRLADALAGAGWVQESGPESLPVKHALYVELDGLSDKEAILASSTSSLDMSGIADGLAGRARCVVAHPTNPPHVAPATEIVPGRDTSPETMRRAAEFMAGVGQTPVVLHRYVTGFVLNRLQSALVREAMGLVAAGVADVDAIDSVVRDGLGLRWALMGPFGVADTNADGGVREYYSRYGGVYTGIMNDLYPTPDIDGALIERLGQGADEMMRRVDRSQIRRWRDTMLRAIVELKSQNPSPWEGDT